MGSVWLEFSLPTFAFGLLFLLVVSLVLYPNRFDRKIFIYPFTIRKLCGILIFVRGALAQLVAHNTGSVGVSGSNPLCSTPGNPYEIRVSGFLFASVPTTIPTLASFSVPTENRYALFLRSILVFSLYFGIFYSEQMSCSILSAAFLDIRVLTWP